MKHQGHVSVGQLDTSQLSAQQMDKRPPGLARTLKSFLQLRRAAFAHQMIVVSRMTCAVVLLVLAMTDPFVPGFRFEFDDLFALGFAGFAFLTLTISLRSWYADCSLSAVFIFADTLAFIVLATPHSVADTGSALSSLCLMAHILFSAYLRWGTRLAIAVSVFLNTFWIIDILLFELPRGSIDQGTALRWTLFAVVCSLIVLWTSIRISGTSPPRFRVRPPPPGFPLATSAFGYAMQAANANGATLCWIEEESLGCFACDAAGLEERQPPAMQGYIATGGFKSLEPMLFDAGRNRAIVSEDGRLASRRDLSAPTATLLKELGVNTGICVPIDGAEGRSWLFLTGIPMLGWGHLQLMQDICAEISHGIEWQTASIGVRDAAIVRLRQTVARDLHDSVAHSLAGARFLLVALRSKVSDNPAVAEEIDSIRSALDAEHLHVRRLIAQLRETDADPHKRNLVEDIDAILPILASRWLIDVKIVESDYRINVPAWLSLEIQQIVRETIGNGVRHGKASEITIQCTTRHNATKLEITDNGCGFPTPEPVPPPRSISERVSELGGTLEINSRPGATVLRISIPFSD